MRGPVGKEKALVGSTGRNTEPLLICVVGPTAVGKTAVGIALAKALNTVVISADSRQFYREMSIGTAKPNLSELDGISHYFINSHSIEDNLSAGDYEREALALLDELFRQYPVVILVGGSGLFVQALCQGLDDLPVPAPGIREKWNLYYIENGIEGLQKALSEADPIYYEQVDIRNPQRLIRALEVWESTGQAFSSFRKKQTNLLENLNANNRFFRPVMIGLEMDREQLYTRINQRVDQMMEEGLLDEVRSLKELQGLPVLKTVGYAELFDFLDGKCTLEEAMDKIKQNTRRYAKRQFTWFKKDPSTTWFEPTDLKGMIGYIQENCQKPNHETNG